MTDHRDTPPDLPSRACHVAPRTSARARAPFLGFAALFGLGGACQLFAFIDPPPPETPTTVDGGDGLDAPAVADGDAGQGDAARGDAGDAGDEIDAAACLDPVTTGTFKTATDVVYVSWAFKTRVTKLEFDIEIVRDPGNSIGTSLSLFSGTIGQDRFALSLQNEVFRTAFEARGYPRGVLFVRFAASGEAAQASDYRVQGNSADSAGDFDPSTTGGQVSVGSVYPWGVGRYHLRMERAADGDVQGDWFDISMEDLRFPGEVKNLGGVRFPRENLAVPLEIEPNGLEYHQFYTLRNIHGGSGGPPSDETPYADVPTTLFDLMAYGNGTPASAATSAYPAAPADFPNSDVWYDKTGDRVHIAFGGATPRCHKPQPLFSRK